MTGPADPASRDEYDRLFQERTRTDGFGLDVHQIVPCPFCAAADWATWWPAAGVVDDRPNMEAQLAQERTCSSCGRSARGILTRTDSSLSVEFVQTGGDPPPPYLPPIRRVEAAE